MDWMEPTEQEKKAVRDPLDIPIIAVIKGLGCEDRKLIYDSIRVKEDYQADFMETQGFWISDFKEYWIENHNYQDPTGCVEFGNDLVNSKEFERFRLYYAAKYPERIEIKKVNKRVLEFLLETEEFMRIEKLIVSTVK